MLLNFDATKVAPLEARSSEPMPKGSYMAIVAETEARVSKKGDDYINLTIKIIDGPHTNRRVWDIIMRKGSPAAIAMGQKKLSALCHATGKTFLKDTTELHDIPIMVTLGIEEAKNGYDAKNKVTGYLPAAQPQAAAPQPQAAVAPAPAPQAAAATAPAQTPPWAQ